MGTREYALLQVHSIRLEKTANIARGASETGVSSICATPICFTWRSEEEVMDGGHMNVGQACRAFELFTGRAADEARMEAHFRRLAA